MKGLKGTRTAENLMKAFAGESQARTRYTYYAGIAKKQGYIQISNIFMETAEQEKEHAKIFYKFLKSDFKDEDIKIKASYPVSFHDDTLLNLKAAACGEHEEWTNLYPSISKIAKIEGFDKIAAAFEKISTIEKSHEMRYLKLAKNIEDNTIFKKEKPVFWKCLNCGYIYEGKEAPLSCPACAHPQGYFEIFVEPY